MSENMGTGMKKGRPSIEETLGLERIRKVYDLCGGSIRSAAKSLGVSRKALTKVVKRYGWEEEGAQKFRAGDVRHHMTWDSKLSTWLKDNPTKHLPYNYREIGRIIGASHEAVRSWYKNENERLEQVLTRLPDLRTFDLTLKDEKNRIFSTNELVSYRFRINRWTFESKIIGIVSDHSKNEGSEIIFPIDNLKKFISRIKAIAADRDLQGTASAYTPDPSKSSESM